MHYPAAANKFPNLWSPRGAHAHSVDNESEVGAAAGWGRGGIFHYKVRFWEHSCMTSTQNMMEGVKKYLNVAGK